MIKEIFDAKQKQEITKQIILSLPDWFGQEQANKDYIRDATNMTMFAYFIDENVVGFISLNAHHASTIEIHVMGILSEHHRKGIGKTLVEYACRYAKAENYKLVEVKTLDGSHPDPYYAKTRTFYESLGFIPVETFEELWGKENPCLLLIKPL